MIEVLITDEMCVSAQRHAENIGKRPNSIRKGEGNYVGCLGQEMFLKHYGGQYLGTHDFDVLLDGIRFEIKTKETSVKPKPYYMCSVCDANTKQDADYYVFCRAISSKNIGWILGAYPKKKYFCEAQFCKKDDHDPDNDFYVKADCWNMQIKTLISIDRILGITDTSQMRLGI